MLFVYYLSLFLNIFGLVLFTTFYLFIFFIYVSYLAGLRLELKKEEEKLKLYGRHALFWRRIIKFFKK